MTDQAPTDLDPDVGDTPAIGQRLLGRLTRDRGYWAVAAGVLVVTVTASLTDDSAFERFLGAAPPVLVVTLTAVVGALSLRVLTERGWPPTGRGGESGRFGDGVVWASTSAVLLAAVAIAFDRWVGFPEDLNTPWPESLLFYPAIGFVAEVAFHVVPLAALIAAFGWNLDPLADDRRVWFAIVAVALVESVFQTVDALMGTDQRLALFVAPHLLTIGIFELVVFRRYGFVPMATFRLVYYMIWHIVWGPIRLDVLF